ncbi:MAG: ABC transporter substrate-binding protein [Chitinispirillales bacterium]|jgi:NitT/TauT family transport system substrate-binding protein|nr:ABC transporter substrate-binding protein [Chitinispirillales bacterium]
MKVKKIHAAVLTAAFAFTIAAGLLFCGGKPADGKFKFGKIDIPGKDGALCNAPLYIAYEKGFLAEEGFDVNLISADIETKKIGLNNGAIPIVNGDFQFFPSIEQGVNVKVVDGLHNGCIKFVVRPGSDIRAALDLKGKKVGVDEIGGTPHQVASVWLEQAGVSALPEKGQVTFLPFSDGNLELQALYNGDIDVAAMWDPLGSIAAKAGKAEIIFDLSTDPAFAGKYCCFLYASNKVLKANPQKVAAILRAYNKAQDWISKNAREAVDIITDKKYAAIEDKELAEELVKSYAYPSAHNRESNHQDVGGDVLYFARALHDIGYLTTDPQAFTEKAYQKIDLTQGQ